MIRKFYGSLLCVGFLFFLSCSTYRHSALKAEGNEIIAKVEKFKIKEGRLPASLEEIGINEKGEGPLYYQKVDENKYQIWFGTSLGESAVYDSNRKEWK